MSGCEPTGDFTIWCPCARLHVHIAVPRYVSLEAAALLAGRLTLPSCPFCGEKPAPVPASSEVGAK